MAIAAADEAGSNFETSVRRETRLLFSWRSPFCEIRKRPRILSARTADTSRIGLRTRCFRTGSRILGAKGLVSPTVQVNATNSESWQLSQIVPDASTLMSAS